MAEPAGDTHPAQLAASEDSAHMSGPANAFPARAGEDQTQVKQDPQQGPQQEQQQMAQGQVVQAQGQQPPNNVAFFGGEMGQDGTFVGMPSAMAFHPQMVQRPDAAQGKGDEGAQQQQPPAMVYSHPGMMGQHMYHRGIEAMHQAWGGQGAPMWAAQAAQQQFLHQMWAEQQGMARPQGMHEYGAMNAGGRPPMMGTWDMGAGTAAPAGDEKPKRKRGRPKGVKDEKKRTRRTKKELGIQTKKELRAASGQTATQQPAGTAVQNGTLPAAHALGESQPVVPPPEAST